MATRTSSARHALPILSVFLVAAFCVPSTAWGKPDKLAKAFKGQLLISDDALPAPDAEDIKGTIKTYKAQTLKVITSDGSEGAATWNFHFTAFMKSKPKTSSLTLEFYTDDKEKLFVADKRLNGADPNATILASVVRISEDENLNRNRKYIIKLVANIGKKSTILASTKIATK